MNILESLIRKGKLINEVFVKMASKKPKGLKAYKWDKNCEDCSKDVETFDENY